MQINLRFVEIDLNTGMRSVYLRIGKLDFYYRKGSYNKIDFD